jgi:hypothetical protein
MHCYATLFILNTINRDDIVNLRVSSSDFEKPDLSRRVFERYSNMIFFILLVGAELFHADGWTDGHD